MSKKNEAVDHNAKPLDDGTGLRGGTEGGGTAHLIDPNHMPSQASVGSASGSTDSTTATHAGQPRNARAHSASRHPSPSEVRTQARDAADIPADVTRPGLNEADPAIERKEGRSDGNKTAESQLTPAERGDGATPKKK